MSIQAAVFCPYSPFPPSVFSREEQLECVEYIHSFSFINKEILHQAKGKKKIPRISLILQHLCFFSYQQQQVK